MMSVVAKPHVNPCPAAIDAVHSNFERVSPDGSCTTIARSIAVEAPVAITFNGIGYAVMMATPADLEDFAVGFTLSERLVDDIDAILSIDQHRTAAGIVLRIQLPSANANLVVDRVRHRVSDSSCGLCGIESLEHALRPLPDLPSSLAPAPEAIFAAIERLRECQPLNRETGAVHGAARCSPTGEILVTREDVGRHNAFDKLIGAMARGRSSWGGGFALLSSRCSYELVEKAALASCPTLVTLSAATDLAIARARSCNLRLISLARPDAFLADPERIEQP